LNCWIIGRG